MDDYLKDEDITTKQFFIMILIGSFDNDPRIGEISDLYKTSRQNVKQVVLKLQKAGYVQLYKDPKDSRIKRVKTTSKAQEFWDKRNDIDTSIINHIFHLLTNNELIQFNQSTIKVMNQIEGDRR
jgi:DNA-binding MarR family transcriptional regulator